MKKIVYLLIGVFFGIVLFKSEAASWFRIYEMFNFHSFHMYGIIGTAILLGVVIIRFIKYRGLTDVRGEVIVIPDKEKSIPRYLIGGIIFGLGWALAGACPGPMYAILGLGVYPILIVLVGAIAGTWIYGMLRIKLPH